MHQGNWKCSKCGGAITELPFQPRSESGLTCRTCYAKGKDAEKTEEAEEAAPEMETAGEPMPSDGIPDFDESHVAGEPMPADDAFNGLEGAVAATPGEKAKVEGKWTCSGCGAPITSLPFEPRNTTGLKCLDCYKQSKA